MSLSSNGGSANVSMVMDELGEQIESDQTDVKKKGDRPDLSLSEESTNSSQYTGSTTTPSP